jgi:hypothetical protein
MTLRQLSCIPFAPHIIEELRQMIRHKTHILMSKWPPADTALMQEEIITIVGAAGSMESCAANGEVPNQRIVNSIYVPGKLINVAVRWAIFARSCKKSSHYRSSMNSDVPESSSSVIMDSATAKYIRAQGFASRGKRALLH